MLSLRDASRVNSGLQDIKCRVWVLKTSFSEIMCVLCRHIEVLKLWSVSVLMYLFL